MKRLAAKALSRRRRDADRIQAATPSSLLDFYAETAKKIVNPQLVPPRHLLPIVTALERSETEPIRLCFSTPPQHGKSFLLFMAMVWLLLRSPRPLIYATYNDYLAQKQMRKARLVAQAAGLRFAPDSRAISEWRLANGGELHAGGIGGGITGLPGGAIFVDDPHKNWHDTQSQTIRDSIFEDFNLSIMSRVHPTTPVMVVATRWHQDDLIGRLSTMPGWEVINLPAINPDDTVLWPEQRPLDYLKIIQAQQGEFRFSSLYQGDPQPRGQRVFNAPSTCKMADIPAGQHGMGTDLAYTAKSRADYSVGIDLVKRGDEMWVTHVERKQVTAPDFGKDLKAMSIVSPGVRIRWYYAGPEKGSADFLIRDGVPIDARPATSDKFVRAQLNTAPLWNANKIHVPEDAPWSGEFIRELTRFTGKGDTNDDQVDALVAAVDSLSETVSYDIQASKPRKYAGLKHHF